MRSQEEPEGARGSQEEPGGLEDHKWRSQEVPGGARNSKFINWRCQELPAGARRCQEEPTLCGSYLQLISTRF